MAPVAPGSEPQSVLFLDETGTGDYFGPDKISLHNAALAAGHKPPFPTAFGLAGVLFKRAPYLTFAPLFQDLKQKHFGTSGFALHEYDLRKLKKDPYRVLRDPSAWAAFSADVHALLKAHPFKIVVVTVDKLAMQAQYLTPNHPYRYSLHVILERVINDHAPAPCVIVAEDRAPGMNGELGSELLRLQLYGGGSDVPNSGNTVSADELRKMFDPNIRFRTKLDNDAGLQVADLAAGPVTRHLYGFDAKETRSLLSAIAPKIRACPWNGRVRGWGIKCLPTYPDGCPW